ncbi:MAG: DMT family transporter [Streptococcaceae bacterium]|jgi:transporter family-2 protein|nr:DMT family transporter [Streptococcaceae bacterium]
MLIYIGLALIAGFALSNQGPINSSLKYRINSALWSAVTSQTVGVLLLAIFTLSMSLGLFMPLSFVMTHPWWIWIGCFIGPIYMTFNIYLFQKLGSVQAVILPILGQVIMGVLIDSFGWFDQAKLPISGIRMIGILVSVLGILIVVVLPNHQKNATKTASTHPAKILLFWRILGIFTGILIATQQAVNSHLGMLVGSSVKAGFLSFFLGLLLIFCVCLAIERKFPKKSSFRQVKPWNFLGGLCGAVFVVAVIIAVPKIGTGLNILLTLVGQMIGSLLIQQFGWWKSPKEKVNREQILGVVVMIFGIICIKFM